MTSMLSILHRMTGFGLSLGLFLFTAWLCAAAYDAAWLESIKAFAQSWLGILLLFGWSFAFYYHLANGIRHLVWDTGRMLEMETATKGGFAVLGFAFGGTIATWVYLAMEMGS